MVEARGEAEGGQGQQPQMEVHAMLEPDESNLQAYALTKSPGHRTRQRWEGFSHEMKQDVYLNCSSKYGDALFEYILQKAKGSQAHRALLVAQPAVQVAELPDHLQPRLPAPPAPIEVE